MLTASEGSIYERFGFGISTRHQVIELRRRDVEFARRGLRDGSGSSRTATRRRSSRRSSTGCDAGTRAR